MFHYIDRVKQKRRRPSINCKGTGCIEQVNLLHGSGAPESPPANLNTAEEHEIIYSLFVELKLRIFINVQCGFVTGAARRRDGKESLVFEPGTWMVRPVHVCASATKATIKTVRF